MEICYRLKCSLTTYEYVTFQTTFRLRQLFKTFHNFQIFILIEASKFYIPKFFKKQAYFLHYSARPNGSRGPGPVQRTNKQQSEDVSSHSISLHMFCFYMKTHLEMLRIS